MKKYVRGALRAVCLLAVLFLYVSAQQQAEKLAACNRTALILMERSPLTGSRVEEMQKAEEEQEQPREFTAWSQKNGVEIKNENLARSHTVAAVAVCGRSDLVLEGTARLDGDDREGCLIDENTAEKLFGNTNVTGLPVEIAGEEKIIRGILYDAEDTVLYEADKEEEFPYLTVTTDGSTSYEKLRQDFMARHALEGSFVRMDTLGRILGLLVLLIPLIVVCRAGGHCLRQAWEYRREWAGALLLAAALCMVCFCVLAVGQIQIPADMIPTKWSDSGFWSDFVEKERQSLLLLLLTEKQKPLQSFVEGFYLGAGESLTAVILALKIKIL